MAETFTQSTLQESLQNVPEDIRSWIGSEKITNTIGKLNDKLGLKGDQRRKIPRLILRLETKDLHPAEFIEEIAHNLNIGIKSANMIASEVKEDILKPIEPSLEEWGVNIDLIDSKTTETSTQTTEKSEDIKGRSLEKEGSKSRQIPIKKSPVSELETTTGPAESIQTQEPEKEEKPKPSDIKPEQPKEKSDEPFMIHQESNEDRERKTVEKRKRSFSFSNDGFFGSKEKSEESSPKADIKTPQDKKSGGIFGIGKKKKEDKKRVVNYSDNRTSLSGDDGNGFINLSNLQPSSKGSSESTPKPKSQPKPETPSEKSESDDFQKNSQKNKIKQKEEKKNDSGKQFLGNVEISNDENKTIKKDFEKENKDNDGDGPTLDGNKVDLRNN